MGGRAGLGEGGRGGEGPGGGGRGLGVVKQELDELQGSVLRPCNQLHDDAQQATHNQLILGFSFLFQ